MVKSSINGGAFEFEYSIVSWFTPARGYNLGDPYEGAPAEVPLSAADAAIASETSPSFWRHQLLPAVTLLNDREAFRPTMQDRNAYRHALRLRFPPLPDWCTEMGYKAHTATLFCEAVELLGAPHVTSSAAMTSTPDLYTVNIRDSSTGALAGGSGGISANDAMLATRQRHYPRLLISGSAGHH
jgi:hypothetical protein